MTEAGYINVNERLETTAPGVWAIGESGRQPAVYRPVSVDDFRVVQASLTRREPRD